MKLLSPLLPAIAGFALACAPPAAAEMSPAEVYARAAPAVGTLELLNADGVVIDLRSAVLVAKNRWLTVCEGLAAATSLKVSSTSQRLDAQLIARDAKRNLCALATPAATPAGTPLEIRDEAPAPGLRVFAVSNALGLGVGVSDGLVGGVRSFPEGSYIQFSAPVSPGSQGGALLDDVGRLLGIIEYRHRSGQNVNFAAPATWIGEVDARAAADRLENQRHDEAAGLARDARWVELNSLARAWATTVPESPEAWRFAARAAAQLGDTAQALAAWQNLRRLAPDANDSAIGLATVLLKQGQVEPALALAEKQLARDAQDASIWLVYAQALRAAGKSGEAEVAYRRATELDPWLLDAYADLAALAEERGDAATALAIWSRLSGLYPNIAAFRYQLVRALLQAGQPDRAYTALRQLPEGEGESATASYWRGITLRKLGRPVAAVAALRESIARSSPGDMQTWIALSIALAELRRHPEAIDAAQHAVHADPDNADAKFWLAVQLKDGGRAAEAITIARALLDSRPADAAVWRLHGFTLALLGKRKEAIKSLEKSLELEPKQGKVWAALAETAYADGQDEAARRAYEQLRTIDPEYARQVYKTLIVTYEERAR
ncbi:serine protease [Candidatus Accumulibacter sp. ACC003]|uniref:serine protease n=1 Tax=Candidatus Accumulibacter sp. ACC003 TaxID=2823334 RepID=UPI0025BB65C0|nr:serine protease [Candidatus Accumulibacter sp. ACC003]